MKMNWKGTALAVLLLLAVAPAASATSFHTPSFGADYSCSYTNPPYPSIDGLSTFVLTSTQYDAAGNPIYRGIEYFDASFGTDNRKFTFAKPVNHPPTGTPVFTRWELTINPGGPQCKNTDVYGWGQSINFTNCTDGHTRYCYRLY